ncbi:hypothetical protein R1flu_020733 [Riccia fluitans]|uniref:Uncharacterized protein n=1 Tax=Riccia fluitans TaxID=41844 RepID=A0ABD1ZMB9_9MARC
MATPLSVILSSDLGHHPNWAKYLLVLVKLLHDFVKVLLDSGAGSLLLFHLHLLVLLPVIRERLCRFPWPCAEEVSPAPSIIWPARTHGTAPSLPRSLSEKAS